MKMNFHRIFHCLFFSNSKSVPPSIKFTSNELEITELSSYVHSQESKVKSVAILMKVLNHIKIFFSKLILGNLLTTKNWFQKTKVIDFHSH
jgi:hypothetical protein